MINPPAKDITIFVDESGTIAKGVLSKKDYFIITLLIVDNNKLDHLKKAFKRSRLKVVKKSSKLYEELSRNKEVKGSSVTEEKKHIIYEKVFEKCSDCFEIGVLILDNKVADTKFRSNSSRAFNFLIKTYLSSYFKKYSNLKDINSINFIIDERNIATESKYTLQEYLNTELNLVEHFSNEDIKVRYYDSKKFILLQMADFISNTFYRKYQKNDCYSNENIELLLSATCKGSPFIFPYSRMHKK